MRLFLLAAACFGILGCSPVVNQQRLRVEIELAALYNHTSSLSILAAQLRPATDPKEEALHRARASIAAAGAGSWESLEILSAHGYPLGFVTQTGDSLAHLSAYKCKADWFNRARKAGVALQLANMRGETPLHLAAFVGCDEIVKILIEEKVALNPQNVDGETPLHMAAWQGHLKTAQILIKAGASTSVRSKKEKTPLDFARQQNHPEIVKALQETRK